MKKDDLQPPRYRQEEEPNNKTREINYRNTHPKFRFLSIPWIKKKLGLMLKEDKAFLINMELENGMFTTFIVFGKEQGFKYNDKKYVFDDALKYWHVPTGLFAYDFHENFALPIRKKIDLNEINKAVSGSGITEIEYMTNPSTLERFTVSKIAEGIMKGQQLDEFFKQIRLLAVITVLEVTLLLILFVAKTGMLKSIKIPGFGG